MFLKLTVLLLTCLVQINCEDEFVYSTCIGNVAAAKALYDSKYNTYDDTITKWLNEHKEVYEKKLSEMKNEQHCTNKYYNDDDGIILDVLLLCGGFPAQREFYKINWDSLIDDNEVCNLICIKGPQIRALAITISDVAAKCDHATNFNTIYEQFKKCEAGCPAA